MHPYKYDFRDHRCAPHNNKSTRIATHKSFPCACCPDAISAIGNRLETPRRRDNKPWRDAMIHMLRVVEVSQSV